MLSQMVPSAPAPARGIVRAASRIAALATTFGMQTGVGIRAHRGTLIRPQGTRNQSNPEYSIGAVYILRAIAVLLLLNRTIE
jgi:hypothetical protein